MPIAPLAPIFKFADGPGIDAFGRLRTSSQITIFDSQQVFGPHELIWDHYTSGTGAITHQLDRSSSYLTTGGTASGARALRQSKVYHRYIPGTSLIFKMTGVPLASGTHSGGSRSVMMFGDDDNGIGLMHDATGWALIKRSKSTGSVVETIVRNTDWSIDKMNANPMQSPSMITLDPTKSHIFVIDLQWLGVGRIRCGLQINGQMYPVHEFVHANIVAGVYMQTATLPARWEVVNTSSGADITMEAICCSVEIEGSLNEENGYPWSVTNGVAPITVTNVAYTPVLSIRLADLFNSGKTARSHVHLGSLEAFVTNSACHYQVIMNASLTGASWQKVNVTHSGIEYDVSATAYTGGIVRGGGYWAVGVDSDPLNNHVSAESKLFLGKKYDGTADTLTIVARAMTAGTTTVATALSLIEQY